MHGKEICLLNLIYKEQFDEEFNTDSPVTTFLT